MLERDIKNKYFRELGGALVIYTAVLFGTLSIANRIEPGTARTLLLMAPMIPVMLAVWAIARQFRRTDEFVRLQNLESVAIAAGVTAGWTLTYGFLENAGYPKLSMFWVWPVMGFVWGLHSCLRMALNK